LDDFFLKGGKNLAGFLLDEEKREKQAIQRETQAKGHN